MKYLLSILCLFVLSCNSGGGDAINRAESRKILDVPVLTQDPKAPPEGWCGSTSIQMVLSYYGFNYSQEEINNKRTSDNPTIYLEDILPVISGLTNDEIKAHAVRFHSIDSYKEWIVNEIDNNRPVLASFTMYPLTAPNWMWIHHYSVIYGYDENGIYISTTWEKAAKQYRTWEQLLTKNTNGLSFVHSVENKKDVFLSFKIYQ